MSSKLRPGPVERWAHSEPGRGVDADVAEAFRVLADEEPMDRAALAAVGRRLAQQAKPASRRPFRHLPLVLAVLTCGTGAAFAQFGRSEAWTLRELFAPRAQTSASVAAAGRASRLQAAVAASVHPLPAEAAPVSPPVVTTAPVAGAEVTQSPSVPNPPAPRPSQLAQESELLQKALAKLRRDHDAAAALVLLDDYGARFPRGVLALEASVARVDALLLAGRRGDALARLAQLPLDKVGRRLELQLVRAELYAERDCSKALSDFEVVLGKGVAGGLGERALYGRATCRLRLGDAEGGRADLQAYLSRHPRGRFAEQIRARLGAR